LDKCENSEANMMDDEDENCLNKETLKEKYG
jgi:hypothetical protein